MSKAVKGLSWFKRLFPNDKAEVLPTVIITAGVIGGGVALAVWKDFNYPKVFGKHQPQEIAELETGRHSMPPAIGPAFVGKLQNAPGPKATLDNTAPLNSTSSIDLKKESDRPVEVISQPKGLEKVLPNLKQPYPEPERPPSLTKPRTIPHNSESTVPPRMSDHSTTPKAM